MGNKIGSVLLSILLAAIVWVSVENILLKKELQNLKHLLEQTEKSVKEIKRPLPVCRKNESHAGCRPLAADESGSTIRGVRDEESTD